jgi:hypothetical protein
LADDFVFAWDDLVVLRVELFRDELFLFDDFLAGFELFELLRPEPDFFPPPSCLLTVAQARRSDSPLLTPRFSYPSSMCSAFRFCFPV